MLLQKAKLIKKQKFHGVLSIKKNAVGIALYANWYVEYLIRVDEMCV